MISRRLCLIAGIALVSLTIYWLYFGLGAWGRYYIRICLVEQGRAHGKFVCPPGFGRTFGIVSTKRLVLPITGSLVLVRSSNSSNDFEFTLSASDSQEWADAEGETDYFWYPIVLSRTAEHELIFSDNMEHCVSLHLNEQVADAELWFVSTVAVCNAGKYNLHESPKMRGHNLKE